MSEWIPVQQEPTREGWYQILYEGDPPDEPVTFYSTRYWDLHNWRVKTPSGGVGAKCVFGNHQRQDVKEFWRELP